MSKTTKVFLFVGAVLFLLLIVGVFAGFLWFRANKDDWVAEAKLARKEGLTYGSTHTTLECEAQTLERLNTKKGLGPILKHKTFFRSCLETARPDPRHCDEVPPLTNLFQTPLWLNRKCDYSALEHMRKQACFQAFSELQTYCQFSKKISGKESRD